MMFETYQKEKPAKNSCEKRGRQIKNSSFVLTDKADKYLEKPD